MLVGQEILTLLKHLLSHSILELCFCLSVSPLILSMDFELSLCDIGLVHFLSSGLFNYGCGNYILNVCLY